MSKNSQSKQPKVMTIVGVPFIFDEVHMKQVNEDIVENYGGDVSKHSFSIHMKISTAISRAFMLVKSAGSIHLRRYTRICMPMHSGLRISSWLSKSVMI